MFRFFNLMAVLLLAFALAGCASRQSAPTLAASKSADADVLYEQARPFMADNEDAAAVRQLSKAVKAGSPEAAFWLARMYEDGRVAGVSPAQSKANADSLVHQSAEAGYALAQVYLAGWY